MTDKEKYVVDLFWALIDNTMVERIEPSRCPAAPDVHYSYDYPVRRWDKIDPELAQIGEEIEETQEGVPLTEDSGDCLQNDIGKALEEMIQEVRSQFRDKIATLRVRVTRPETGCDAIDRYHVYLIASLGEIK